ncbi:DUF418 domain-containing protein [Actinomadura sp. NEAU-AAG7]|uniref:DUF418 domain-containing protein n=1 Tax=Actinomadura sp. NEAU-AAG7 TaxID=2839640 RepID=UPI001BE3F2AC|nr:DUF418 domain-containing protein [Actinomadura sp. NEAU-AAG7]MBT2207664.1 DUF418 domain-containing protein [Actinomadura sp. NEAU-AAG7]
MTQQAPPSEHGASATRRDAPATGRLVGLDLARCLAVFGMYVAHVGPDPADGGPTGVLAELTHGRSMALFALLGGVTLVIIGGRRTPKTGRPGRQAAAKVVIRAAILVPLGVALTMTPTDVDVVLAYYGAYFLLALPLIRLRARTLALIAVGWALVGPQLSFVMRDVLDDLSDGAIGGGALVRVSGEGLLDLLFTGTYPALTYMPFLIAGMAFGRLDLASRAVRVRLAALGGALTVLGYGGSWLAFRLLPGLMGETGSPAAWWSDVDGDPSEGAAWLLTAAPHGETTLSLAGGTGAALLVTVAALAAVDRLPRLRRLAVPLIAVGSMSLTAYVAHIVVLLPRGAELPEWPPHILLGFMLAVTVPAFLWSRYFRRGPLEHLVHTASLASRCVR